MRSRAQSRVAVAVALSLLTARPTSVRADILTNYTFSYTTAASFFCNSYYAAYCTVGGKGVTLTNGGSSLTFTFAGLSAQATVIRGFPTFFGLGTLTQSGSNPFEFPNIVVPAVPIFTMNVSLTETDPASGAGGWSLWAFPMGATPTTMVLARAGTDFTDLPIPAGFSASELVATLGAESYLVPGDGSAVRLGGYFSIVPEPNTGILLGTGIGAIILGGLASRRRRTRVRRSE